MAGVTGRDTLSDFLTLAVGVLRQECAVRFVGHLPRKETNMFGYGILGTLVIIVLVVWLMKRV